MKGAATAPCCSASATAARGTVWAPPPGAMTMFAPKPRNWTRIFRSISEETENSAVARVADTARAAKARARRRLRNCTARRTNVQNITRLPCGADLQVCAGPPGPALPTSQTSLASPQRHGRLQQQRAPQGLGRAGDRGKHGRSHHYRAEHGRYFERSLK